MATKTIRCCFNCVFACLDSEHAAQCVEAGLLNLPACANHPKSFGRMRRTPACGICPNYRPRPGEPEGDIRLIPLGDGHYAYVDAADYEWLSQWKWHTQGGYAVRYEKKKLIFMHRQITDAPKGKVVDHKNRNRLDNTRTNLRICTHAENTQNARKIQGTHSCFKGVSYRKERDKYFAQIYHQGDQIYLGLFVKETDAARAYDRKAIELFGEFARVNFPEEWPPDRHAPPPPLRIPLHQRTEPRQAIRTAQPLDRRAVGTNGLQPKLKVRAERPRDPLEPLRRQQSAQPSLLNHRITVHSKIVLLYHIDLWHRRPRR